MPRVKRRTTARKPRSKRNGKLSRERVGQSPNPNDGCRGQKLIWRRIENRSRRDRLRLRGGSRDATGPAAMAGMCDANDTGRPRLRQGKGHPGQQQAANDGQYRFHVSNILSGFKRSSTSFGFFSSILGMFTIVPVCQRLTCQPGTATRGSGLILNFSACCHSLSKIRIMHVAIRLQPTGTGHGTLDLYVSLFGFVVHKILNERIAHRLELGTGRL